MGEFLKVIIDKLSTISKKAIVGWIIAIVLFVLAIFPYLDTNLFYPNRVKNRVEILDMVTKLDTNQINNNPKLKQEYDNILSEINNSNENYISNFFKTKENGSTLWKFICGASLWWMFAIFMLFYKDKTVKSKKQMWINKGGGFFFLGLLGALIGWIFSIIPTIGNPWINYIGAPILTIVIMVLLFYSASKNK